MNALIQSARPARGMTLPELMVGLAVGLFVSTVAIATFVSTRTLNVVNSSSTRMTENARLATETLHTDLRSAGFAGCRTLEQRLDGPPVVVPSAAITGSFISAGNSGVVGYTGSPTGHSPALPSALTSLGAYAPLNQSDVVAVRVPADTAAFGVRTSTSAAVQLADPPPGIKLQMGDVVLVSNCKAAAVFEVVSDPRTSGTLTYTTGADLQHLFRSDSSVYRIQTRYYFVAPSALRAGTNALWRHVVPPPHSDEGPATQEIASGIDRLQFSYGIDTDTPPDLNVNQYTAAAAGTDWDRVLSARVQLVAATAEDRMAQGNQTYKFDGANVTATDKRLRTVLTEVVALRNGTP